MDSHVRQQVSPPPDADNVGGARVISTDGHDDPKEYDWTAQLPQTDHVRFFRSIDWAHSGLGPLKDWSTNLRLFTGFVLADSRAACLWWGPDSIAIYNEHFAPMSAEVHPTLMGSTYAQGFPEIWPYISALLEESRRTGGGQNVSAAAPLLVERNGYKEEAFFSGSFIPVGPAHQPEGFYNSVYEVTNQKLSDRRTSMLNMLATVPSQNIDDVFAHVLATLETNPNDIPFAMLYKFEGLEPTVLQSRGYIGVPEGHDLDVQSARMETGEEGLIPDLRRAGSDTVVFDYDDRFEGISWKGWDSPSRKLAILPITSITGRIFGYLVIGTNPYRPFDSQGQQLVDDLARMTSSIVSAAVDFDLSRRRQEQLVADLAFSDLKLRHLIDHASVGMCHISLDGRLLWANDHYYRLAGRTPEEHSGCHAFFILPFEEDRLKAQEAWSELLARTGHVSIEVRSQRMYAPPSGEDEPAQIQILAFPYRDPETDDVKSIMACTTDISRLKWAQNFHARSAAEAREAKRQQEAFIDVVSHEMRNPLSAIVHCADAIVTAAEECQAQLHPADIPPLCLEALNDNLQSAKIVLQCASHQKRIIDDVLTLSKLNSMLLSITPVAVQLPKMIQSIVDMFEAEMRSNSIQCNLIADGSIADLTVDHVYLDPSRITQIFINLLTNAIKFVKPSNTGLLNTTPSIIIRFGACLSDPQTAFPSEMFWANGHQDGNVTRYPEWGVGEEIYLTFSVQDSGIGLRDQDIKKIFERFQQAHVKTHVQYGGTGLGLFISKELTEKQGGQIGVCSTPGKGSTFGFFVKTRRVEQQLPINPKPIRGKSETTIQQLHVLLVEDNVINQQVLGKQLRKAGCIVEVANHGLEALQILEQKTFDIVLMDSEMPILDGLAATRSIREKETTRQGLLGQAMARGARAGARLPIIAVTANVRKEQIEEALAAGADRVVQKPFKAKDLVHLMKEHTAMANSSSAER
ncbi:hypothetical protein T440DRAFT_152743 [Plenodomus tracheiphilus IPT5]|uniref:Histidine kinase HHK15p n=1 Tax=Plenodomus tracheiphilus IPT5 TaxID=1408161 RepID=A0A6A7BJG4_9PLEO|nr:hypothetical protein T440DRAFT_152743 [Plenodomus tracheiphilus IPT5]